MMEVKSGQPLNKLNNRMMFTGALSQCVAYLMDGPDHNLCCIGINGNKLWRKYGEDNTNVLQ